MVVGDIRNRVTSTKMGLSVLQSGRLPAEAGPRVIELLQESVDHISNIINALQDYNDTIHGRNQDASDDTP